MRGRETRRQKKLSSRRIGSIGRVIENEMKNKKTGRTEKKKKKKETDTKSISKT